MMIVSHVFSPSQKKQQRKNFKKHPKKKSVENYKLKLDKIMMSSRFSKSFARWQKKRSKSFRKEIII